MRRNEKDEEINQIVHRYTYDEAGWKRGKSRWRLSGEKTGKKRRKGSGTMKQHPSDLSEE